MISERKFITRQMLKNEPDTLFVFGDNIARAGLGGQAKEMRGEPNAVGIVTKFQPSNSEHSFFCDLHFDIMRPLVDEAFRKLQRHLSYGGNVVWPADGVGTGLADLPNRAPKIAAYIAECYAAMATQDQGGAE